MGKSGLSGTILGGAVGDRKEAICEGSGRDTGQIIAGVIKLQKVMTVFRVS